MISGDVAVENAGADSTEMTKGVEEPELAPPPLLFLFDDPGLSAG
jgi:hypothetical protein